MKYHLTLADAATVILKPLQSCKHALAAATNITAAKVTTKRTTLFIADAMLKI